MIVQLSIMTTIRANGIISKKEIVRKIRMAQVSPNIVDMKGMITSKIEIDCLLMKKKREGGTVPNENASVEEATLLKVDQEAQDKQLRMKTT